MASPLIEPVARLIDAFNRLPGIGPTTAQRLTFHILRAPDAEARYAELVAQSDPRAFKLTDDPRVTPTGRYLRRTSLDELRPHLPELPDESRWISNEAQERLGLIACGDELPDLGEVPQLIGKEPEVVEEFDIE